MSNSTTGEIQSTPVSAVDLEPPVPPQKYLVEVVLDVESLEQFINQLS
ncbi:hypothetical protein [Coleofasciculus chthonoplastes]